MTYRQRGRGFDGGVSPYAPVPADAPGRSRETAITISELNDATKTIVESSFGTFWVRGEVSDFKANRSGHWYFCLRDSTAHMACVVWASDQRTIPAPPDDGMAVLALVQLTMYATNGRLQLRVTRMEAAGEGLWRKAMQQTVDRLTAEGLLAPSRKKPLPRYPRVLAVVTSITGAALRDIISVAGRRRPGLRIVVSAASVQGDEAAGEICAAIRRVIKWGRADVMIIGRGGGSREDLRAFNDERVARTIAACRIPIVSAVGHEIDTTVCDLVADVRAATPSAAAETAIPTTADMLAALVVQRRRLTGGVVRRAESAALDLRTVSRDMRLASSRVVERRRAAIGGIAGRLNALSPLATLERGYAVARGPNGDALTSATQFQPGDTFDLTLRDGTIRARTEGTLPSEADRASEDSGT
ncbi:MAG TPA: exodeoxyribonuclease VII large subunit [Gemmatimonadaceae bacterium]|nr:exodeoxyribonuclease VII large subunit [Gemmatimonadaceae bacterium]